jgi:hypothetical protein
MSTPFDRATRERYLADLHVGVFTVATGADLPGGTLAAPIWYQYSPDVGVSIITSRTSRKGVAIEATGRFGIAAQTESIPYAYVCVEGPVVETRPCDFERDLLPMAIRYLGEEGGRAYAAGWQAADTSNDLVYVMRPEFWRTADFTSDFG